jgi:hypothetical protein
MGFNSQWRTGAKHNIPFQPLETKKQLYEKIKFKKLLSVFKTDKIANLHGHEVLRTPVRHCELNPNQSNPPHDYQRAKLSTFYLFLKGSLGHQNHQLVTTCSQWHDSD